ncbi:MAG: alpha/beta fold hydrolase [Chitinophagia bacterium]
MIKSFKIIAFLFIGAFLLSSCDSDIPVAQLKAKYLKPNSAFIDIDGVSVHYIMEGRIEDSLPIVFIHGTSASLHTWDTLSSLLKNNKKIIRLDLPAFGLTGPNRLNQYNFNFYNQFLDEFLSKLNVTKCIVAGNSLGGSIAWNYAIASPNNVKQLILLDASGYPKKDEKGSLGFKLAGIPVLNQALKHISPISLIRKSLEDAFYNKSLVTEKMVQQYHDMLLREGNRAALLELFQHPMKADPAKIKTITQPTLIIWGKQDQLISYKNAALFKQDIQNSQMLVLDNVGHIPMEEAPNQVVTAILGFIK